jgi:hypothetical protein
MYLRDAPLQPLNVSSSPLSSATTFLLGLGILFGLGVALTLSAIREHHTIHITDVPNERGRYQPGPWWRA